MSFTVMRCPVCGAPLRMQKNTDYIICDSCDTALRVNEEHRLLKIDDAEQFGYNFEKGRQRARMEQEGEYHSDYSQNRYSVPYRTNTYVQPRQDISDKDRKTALLICIFLGIYGGHQYYVGNIGKGLLYTFTFGLFCIGWLIDLISIATGSFRDKYGRVLVNLNSYAPEQLHKNQNSNANKRRIFFVLMVIGILGIMGGLLDGDMSGILACALWAGIFYILWKKTDLA